MTFVILPIRLPFMAKKLEEHLYRSALTKEEYVDQSTLKKRLQMIAHGLGVPRSGAKDGSADEQVKRQQQEQQMQMQQPPLEEATNNSQTAPTTDVGGVPLETQVGAVGNFNAGTTNDVQSAQAQHQINLLKEQQQQQLELMAAAMQQQQGQDGSQGVALSKEALLQQLQQQQVRSDRGYSHSSGVVLLSDIYIILVRCHRFIHTALTQRRLRLPTLLRLLLNFRLTGRVEAP